MSYSSPWYVELVVSLLWKVYVLPKVSPRGEIQKVMIWMGSSPVYEV
jgi:hypothetical protein